MTRYIDWCQTVCIARTMRTWSLKTFIHPRLKKGLKFFDVNLPDRLLCQIFKQTTCLMPRALRWKCWLSCYTLAKMKVRKQTWKTKNLRRASSNRTMNKLTKKPSWTKWCNTTKTQKTLLCLIWRTSVSCFLRCRMLRIRRCRVG